MLKILVDKWIKIDENIKEINKSAKSLKEEKEQLSEQISNVMVTLNINTFNLSNGDRLILKKQSSLSSINKEYIHDTLSSFFKDVNNKKLSSENLAQETTEILINSREATEKTVLKKVKQK